MKTADITIKKVQGFTDLFLHYEQDMEIQPAYLYLDCETKELSAEVLREDNYTPEDIDYKRALWWRIPALTSVAANQLMEELKLLAEKIIAGYTWEYDSVNNAVGTYTEEAQNAIDEIEALLQRKEFDYDEIIEEMYYEEWCSDISDYGKITAETTDEELEVIANKLKSSVPGYVILQDDALEYVTEIRDRIREEE